MNPLKQTLKMCLPLAALFAAAAIGGCSSDNASKAEADRPGDLFLAPDEVSEVTRIADQQIAVGARTDATLRAYHFDEATLNSLGREKLDHMTRGSESRNTLVVYLDVPTGDKESEKILAKARHDAVAAQLMSIGLTEDQFRLESGFNPNNTVSVTSANPEKGKPAAGKDGAADAKPSYGGGMSGAGQK